MICFSLFDDPRGQEIAKSAKSREEAYHRLTQEREVAMIRAMHLKSDHFSCVHHYTPRRYVLPIGITTLYAFTLNKLPRDRSILQCLPLHAPIDSPYLAMQERRRFKQPWHAFTDLPLTGEVLATACFRDIVCVLLGAGLAVARYTEGQWSRVAFRALPNNGKPWTILRALAVCAQCVVFACRNNEENRNCVFVVPLLNCTKEETTPLRYTLPPNDSDEVRLFVPEEIYEQSRVNLIVSTSHHTTHLLCADLNENTIKPLSEPQTSLWPESNDEGTDTFIRFAQGTVCHYSYARKQLLFYQLDDRDRIAVRPTSKPVLSVEIFHSYALVHYCDDELELMNICGNYTDRTRMLREKTRSYASVAMKGAPEQTHRIPPYRASRTFSDRMFVMLRDGTVCVFS